MRITEETAQRLVVKRTKDLLWLVMLLIGIGFFLLTTLISAARGSTGENKGRAPASAIGFVFPLASIVFYLLERRDRRKTLIMDSEQRIAVILGSKRLEIPFDKISGFDFGRDSTSRAPLLELELKNGLRVGSGIIAQRGKKEAAAPILEKLTARIN
jgi:hypothetical protein